MHRRRADDAFGAAIFFPDDPVWVDDDRAFDASKVVVEDTNGYDSS
jgi:hypothetical protein